MPGAGGFSLGVQVKSALAAVKKRLERMDQQIWTQVPDVVASARSSARRYEGIRPLLDAQWGEG